MTVPDGVAIRRNGAAAADARSQRDSTRSHWRTSWTRLSENRVGIACGLILLFFGVVAIAAPVISEHVTHYDPASQDLDNVYSSFSERHLLGSDELGRDTLTRLIWGARVSLGVGFLATVLMLVIGGSIGMAAGYYGKLVDQILMRLVDVVLSVPPVFLLILVTSLLPLPIGPDRAQPWFVIKHDAVSLSIVIALTSWGGVARLMRSEVLSIKNRDFMLAARSVGARDWTLMAKHVLPNAIPVLVVAASLGVGQIILLEAALDFIGLGVQPPTSSWGNMLLNAQTYFYRSTLLVIFPGLSIAIAVLAANIFGNAIRDAFDPRLK